MKIIGIDFGDARVGIASSDENETFASAQGRLLVSGLSDAARKAAEKVKELGGKKIVVGLPVNMDGSQSFRAQRTRRFAAELQELTGIEPEFYDERLTSAQASRYLNISDRRGKKRKNVIDEMSAQIILQDYLDHKKNISKMY